MSTCVDLRERFGEDYRLTWDPADESGHQNPWMMQIACERGVIYPWGGDTLAVEVDGRPITANRLAALEFPCVQDGDHEKTFTFPVERFAEVAAIVLPRKRRHSPLTPEQQQQAADNLRQWRAAQASAPTLDSGHSQGHCTGSSAS